MGICFVAMVLGIWLFADSLIRFSQNMCTGSQTTYTKVSATFNLILGIICFIGSCLALDHVMGATVERHRVVTHDGIESGLRNAIARLDLLAMGRPFQLDPVPGASIPAPPAPVMVAVNVNNDVPAG
jgi:hypothetical protein